MENANFHSKLKQTMDVYAHKVYAATRLFPKEEIFGSTSQLRRSALSVILNYIEGYARNNAKIDKYFLDISYGSLQESKYLIEFCHNEAYISKEKFSELYALADEIGKMLWGILKNLK